MRRWSIAARLAWSLTAAIALLLAIALAFSLSEIRHEIDEVFDSAMQETAQRLTPLVARYLDDHDDDDYEEEIGHEAFAAAPPHEEYLIYWVRDQDGRVLLRSHDAPASVAGVPLAIGFAEHDGRRIYTERAGTAPLFVQVGEPLQHREEVVQETMLPLLLAAGALLPMVALAVWLVTSIAMRPLGRLRQELAARDGGNLAVVAINGLPRELQIIVSAVNRLLDRLRAAIEAERTLAASSAHELRTPIAAARAQAQVLAASLSPGPDRDRAELVTDLLARLGRLAEKLLQLTRAESASFALTDEVDVGRLVATIVDDQRRHSERGHRIEARYDHARPVLWRTDADALAIAIQNLIENAFTHGGAEVRVEVVVDEAGAIRVVDDGPGVPAEKLPFLTTRFRRAGNGNANNSGAGLGLSIVATIMAKLGIGLELRSPATGRSRGFEAILRRPTPA